MRGVPIQRAYAVAEAIDQTLLCTNKGYRYCVYLVLEDGGTRLYDSAFAMTWVDEEKKEWLFVFPEHDDIWVCATEDLYDYRLLKQCEIKRHKPIKVPPG